MADSRVTINNLHVRLPAADAEQGEAIMRDAVQMTSQSLQSQGVRSRRVSDLRLKVRVPHDATQDDISRAIAKAMLGGLS